ncbi:MAG: MaoC family dehydratase N-terminal domain-containing protein [Deltaproteobacteria bacterium]|nr:MaoC family dehydratase N-terminal domain-containing protein [Deltaproteobacteria bacterium]
MKLDSKFAGTPLKEYGTKISWRATTNYAAAVGDVNPLYFDDTKERSLVAPPTFPVAVTWPILSHLQDFIAAKDFPWGVLWTQVHYFEHLILHRLVRPEDELAITGKVAAVLPHRAGTHAVMALFARDKSGHPVFTEYVGAMLRGIECDGEKGKEDLPPIPESDLPETAIWSSPVFIDPLLPYVYDGCTHIEFPIHTSPRFAKGVGLPGIILQGTATLALAVREMVNREASGNPALISEVACKFTGMVMPGTDIEIRCLNSGEREDGKELFFEVVNGENQKAIRAGFVKLKKEAA